MASYYLINPVVFAGNRLMPGTSYDDTTDDITKLRAAGAILWPTSNTVIAAAAAVAVNALKNRGANENELALIMQAAVDSQVQTVDEVSLAAVVASAAANATAIATAAAQLALLPTRIQTGLLTLVAGTVTLAAGIVITASSRIEVSLNTHGGTAGARYAIPAASRTVGIAGVGAFTVNAVDAAGSLVNTDTSTLDYTITG